MEVIPHLVWAGVVLAGLVLFHRWVLSRSDKMDLLDDIARLRGQHNSLREHVFASGDEAKELAALKSRVEKLELGKAIGGLK